MKTISPSMNGEFRTMDPVSGLRRGAPGGRVSNAKKASTPASAHPAYFRPRDSSDVTPAGSSTAVSPLYGPSRGSITLSLMSETTTVRSRTDAMENHRLAVNATASAGLTRLTASLVMPVRMASSGLTKMLTLNTAATPANDAASPASGCRPTLRYAAAARGTSTRYPASAAMLEMMPMKTRMYVRAFAGATITSFRISALTRPAVSATPTPSIATMMTPTAVKFMKFWTTPEYMKRMPSAVSRLRTEVVTSSIASVSVLTA